MDSDDWKHAGCTLVNRRVGTKHNSQAKLWCTTHQEFVEVVEVLTV